jgi:hypothetical protein
MMWSASTTIVQAQIAGQIKASRQSTKITSGFGGGTCEAVIVIDAEALQHGVGLGDRFRESFSASVPVDVIALKDIVAVAIQTQLDATGGDHGVEHVEIGWHR